MTRRPRFEVYPVKRWGLIPDGKATEWRWRLRAANGRILASGEGFASKRNAERAVWTVMDAAEAASWASVVEVES